MTSKKIALAIVHQVLVVLNQMLVILNEVKDLLLKLLHRQSWMPYVSFLRHGFHFTLIQTSITAS